MKIKEIKTVRAHNPETFDRLVNEQLDLGLELLCAPNVAVDGTLIQVLARFEEEDTRGAWG